MKENPPRIQDYLDDDSFVQWVMAGRNDGQWRQFLAEHPQQRESVQRARTLVEDIQQQEGADLPPMNQRQVWGRISANLRMPEEEMDHQESAAFRFGNYAAWQWIAGLVVMLGLSLFTWQARLGGPNPYQRLTNTAEVENELIERTNERQTPRGINLEDGSVVILSKDSKLTYPKHFVGKNRNVILTGEGLFEVAKDRERPFYIYAGEVVVRVLGTSFQIRAFEKEKDVTVEVRTGRVTVFKQKRINLNDPETDGLILLPNQQAVISRTGSSLSRRLVADPLPVLKKSFDSLPRQYKEVPASRILRDIETRYGVTILFNDDMLDRCVMTTTLGEESLFDQLDSICRTIGASYKEVDGQLVVESEGCR